MNIREYRAAIDEATAVHSKRIEEVHRELRDVIAKITDEFIGTTPVEPEYGDEDQIRVMTRSRHD